MTDEGDRPAAAAAEPLAGCPAGAAVPREASVQPAAVGTARRPSRLRTAARVVAWAAAGLVLAFFALVALYAFVDPVSTLMAARLVEGKPVARVPVRLADVAPAAVAAVVVSEDATFCANRGVDWSSLFEVLSAKGGPSRGASTLTMQTAKNLFLWPGRSVLRKGLEIPIALVLGAAWPKRRVLEVYLNIAEWGDGVFGVEAAAERSFHKRAADLTAREGALLATALPNPRERDPARPKPLQRRHAAEILARMGREAGALDCL